MEYYELEVSGKEEKKSGDVTAQALVGRELGAGPRAGPGRWEQEDTGPALAPECTHPAPALLCTPPCTRPAPTLHLGWANQRLGVRGAVRRGHPYPEPLWSPQGLWPAPTVPVGHAAPATGCCRRVIPEIHKPEQGKRSIPQTQGFVEVWITFHLRK